MMAAMCVAAIGHVSLSFLPSCLSCMCAWKLYFFPTLAHDGHWSLGGQVQHEPQNLFKILLHHSRKMSESHGGGTAHGAAEDETKLWFWFSRNEGFRLWAWMMCWTSSHGCGSFFFFFFVFVVVVVSFCPSTLHPLFHHSAFFCFLSLSLFLSLSSPPFYSSSPPSPSALSVPFHLSLAIPSAYSKSRTNKQAAGGSSLLSIIQASQTTASMFAKHMKCISLYCREREREREREKKYVLPSWLGHITQRLSQHSTERLKCCLWHFCFVLIENTQGKGRDDGIGRTLWDQKFVKSKPLCFEGEIHLKAKFLTGFLVKKIRSAPPWIVWRCQHFQNHPEDNPARAESNVWEFAFCEKIFVSLNPRASVSCSRTLTQLRNSNWLQALSFIQKSIVSPPRDQAKPLVVTTT